MPLRATPAILDIAWLDGYHAPTLAILCEATPAWVGRASTIKDTKALVALSVTKADLQVRSPPVDMPLLMCSNT